MLTKWRAVLLIIFLGVSTGLCAAFYETQGFHAPLPAWGEPKAAINFKQLNPKIQQQAWSAYIDKVGPARAYEDFVDLYRTAPFNLAHVAMHVFGDILYKKEGADAVGTCDPAFGFACFHQVLLDSVLSQGLSSAGQLAKYCIDKYPRGYGVCQHGLGHGIAELYGITDTGLLKALNACTQVPNLEPVYCQSGVFMEYFQIPFFDPNAKMRPVDPKDPLAPCDTIVPKNFLHFCYLDITSWWLDYYGNIVKTGSLCEKVSPEYQNTCFLGVGESLPLRGTVNFDKGIILRECGKLPSGAALNFCLIGASRSFIYYYGDRDASKTLCAGLPKEIQPKCTAPGIPEEGWGFGVSAPN